MRGVGAASVKLMYAPQPTPEVIQALADKSIRAVACGHNHTLALDTGCAAYTWGARARPSRLATCGRIEYCQA
jgi:alpha-tubulin suppressor-like RCC1 family protein